MAGILLTAGWLASVQAALNGTALDYAKRIDQPSVATLALALLVAAIVAWLIPDREDEA
jgi:hypothetical protein